MTDQPIFTPLTMNDGYRRHQNLAACYQLVQSALKIVTEGWDAGRWVGVTWRVTVHGQLTVEKPWSMLGGHFSTLLHKRLA